MATDQLLSNDASLSSAEKQSNRPLDSSQLLLGLMTFARTKSQSDDSDALNALGGAISPGVLRSLISALHYRDVATVRHSRRVAMLAVGMAHYLGWDAPQQKTLEVSALLHDIGKIGVPDNVLFKPGKLSPDEAELMALHHNIGVDVLQACRVDHQVLEIVAQSRGSWGGYSSETDGYNTGHAGIHQGARILAVADAYDSIATDQVYRQGKPHREIMKVLMEAAGTQFDGNVVSSLARWIDSEGLPFSPDNQDMNGIPEAQGQSHPEDAEEANSLGNIFSYLYLLESLYDGFYLVDSDLRFVAWNRGCEGLFCCGSNEILGQVWTSELVGFADATGRHLSDHESPMKRVITEGRAETSNERVIRTDGKILDVELQSIPLLDEHGHLQGVAEIFRNLSGGSNHRPQEYRELKLAASRDALTSVANRGEMEVQLASLLEEFAEDPDAEPFSVIFLDIDFFKNVNDTFGHSVGDDVLVDVAKLLQNETYSGELVSRYGGEEFVVLCPATGLEHAINRAERLRTSLPHAETGRMGDYKVTASFGITEVEKGDSLESILKRADKALYTAKETGRNRSCSLTTAEMMVSDVAEDIEDENADPFVFENSFFACIAADMIIYKLGGFVNDFKAKLLDVSEKKAVVQVGAIGLLSNWGKTDAKQPIEITIEFGDEHRSSSKGPLSASKEIEIRVQICPLGKINDQEMFQNRARRALKHLRSYFAST